MAKSGVYLVNGVPYRAGRRCWTEADDRALHRLFSDMPTATLAKQLGRSVPSTQRRAALLGLHKSEAYLASPQACRLRRGDNVGAAFRFKNGQTPPNKGLRRPGYSVGRGRMQETQFKKGQRSSTWVPVGTVVKDRDGYLKVKISDDRTLASRFNWRFVHVQVWESAHGPVPKKHAVVFKNGDRSDTRLENLELITRRALMARNTVHNLPAPLPQTIQLLGALNRQIRRRTRAQEQDRRSA